MFSEQFCVNYEEQRKKHQRPITFSQEPSMQREHYTLAFNQHKVKCQGMEDSQKDKSLKRMRPDAFSEDSSMNREHYVEAKRLKPSSIDMVI